MDATQTPTAGQPEPAVTLEAASPFSGTCDDLLCSVCSDLAADALAAHLWADPAPADLDPPPLPDDDENRLTLQEWVTHQSARYRLMGTSAADLVADTLCHLANEIGSMRASSADELDARRDCWESWQEMDELSRRL